MREASSDVPTVEGDSSLTRQLAHFCSNTSYDQIPGPTQARAKYLLLDTLGAVLAASNPSYPGIQRLSQFVHNEGTGADSLVVGTKLRASPTTAALLNGYLAYALDIETLHGPSIMHAAAVVVPVVLSIAQQEGSSGADVLAALVLGIEIACRVSLAIGPTGLYDRGFHPTAVAGSFGASAAASFLLRHDAEQIERAFGLAATQTGGLLAWADDETEESRPLNPGLAARNGLTAARLATIGFGGPPRIFDPAAKYNVFRAWSSEGLGRPSRLLDGLGDSFAIDEVTFKQYSCCGFLHPGLDGLLDIMRSEDLAAEDISGITIRFSKAGAPIIDNNPLRSHRAQYILPLAAVRRAVLFQDVIVDRTCEPEIRRLSGLTLFIQDDAFDRFYPERYTTEVTVMTKGGMCHHRHVDWASGTPQNPMNDAGIIAKFRLLATSRVDEQHADRIIELTEALDRSGSTDDLIRELHVT